MFNTVILYHYGAPDLAVYIRKITEMWMEKTSVFEATQLCFTEIKQGSRQQLIRQAIIRKTEATFENICVWLERKHEKRLKISGGEKDQIQKTWNEHTEVKWNDRQKETHEIKKIYLKNPLPIPLQTQPAPGYGQKYVKIRSLSAMKKATKEHKPTIQLGGQLHTCSLQVDEAAEDVHCMEKEELQKDTTSQHQILNEGEHNPK